MSFKEAPGGRVVRTTASLGRDEVNAFLQTLQSIKASVFVLSQFDSNLSVGQLLVENSI